MVDVHRTAVGLLAAALLLAGCSDDPEPPPADDGTVHTISAGPLTTVVPDGWPSGRTVEERTDAALLLGLVPQDGSYAATAVNADGTCGIGLRATTGQPPHPGDPLPSVYPAATQDGGGVVTGTSYGRRFVVDEGHTVTQVWADPSGTTAVGYVQVVCDDAEQANRLRLTTRLG